jgi:hypothetical protein
VHGKWHHGDDIFAPLGAPVVAVADGTINRVGWHRIGGWRLWVRNASADQFYYAHLSGYVRSVFHSRRVRAGQVIGFVGNTGDAFGGAPHLHFEVHPHQLLRLRYDGAVDPTTYLDSWRHVQSIEAPAPMLAHLPRQRRFRIEARQVFGRLLAARYSIAPSPTAIQGTEVDRPEVSVASQPRGLAGREMPPMATAASEGAPLAFPLLIGFLALAVLVGTPVLGTMMLGRFYEKRVEE